MSHQRRRFPRLSSRKSHPHLPPSHTPIRSAFGEQNNDNASPARTPHNCSDALQFLGMIGEMFSYCIAEIKRQMPADLMRNKRARNRALARCSTSRASCGYRLGFRLANLRHFLTAPSNRLDSKSRMGWCCRSRRGFSSTRDQSPCVGYLFSNFTDIRDRELAGRLIRCSSWLSVRSVNFRLLLLILNHTRAVLSAASTRSSRKGILRMRTPVAS